MTLALKATIWPGLKESAKSPVVNEGSLATVPKEYICSAVAPGGGTFRVPEPWMATVPEIMVAITGPVITSKVINEKYFNLLIFQFL